MSLVLLQSGKSAEEILHDRKERNKEAQKRFRDRRKKLQQKVVLSESAAQQQKHQLELSPSARILIQSITSSNSLYTLKGDDLYSTAIAATSLTTYTFRGQIGILPPRHGYTYAMIRNAKLMGIAADELFDSCKESRMIAECRQVGLKLSCDVIVKKMIDSKGEGSSSISEFSEVPENLRPTPLQLATLHHSSIDTGIVWPSVRDKVMALLTANLLDTDKLIRDILTYDETGGEQAAFHVYGDKTWDPQSWEVGERFAREWHFLFDKDILHTTNDWRRRRGLDNLVLDVGRVSNRA